MIKSSFNVGYLVFNHEEVVTHEVLGVTSIVPNLNGVLMFTEDGENHFIESHELRYETLTGMYITYEDEPILNAVVHDHRSK